MQSGDKDAVVFPNDTGDYADNDDKGEMLYIKIMLKSEFTLA